MKRVLVLMLKVFGFAVAGVVVLVLGFIGYLKVTKPVVKPASAEKVEATPERLARGKYLFHSVANCAGCHSEHEWTYGFPVKADTLGSGDCWDKRLGYEMPMCASNLTPDKKTGLGEWTDGEILRALREGVDRKGNALALAMPYPRFHEMGDEDARAVVAYVRTLAPIEKARPHPQWGFPEDLFIRSMPKPEEGPVAVPSKANKVAYGRYLAQLGNCAECHGEDYAGGEVRIGPSGPEAPANLTPDPKTGLTASREEFIGRFKAYANLAPSAGGEVRAQMPWVAFSGMEEEDLGALYDYLRTLPPVSRQVEKFPKPDAAAAQKG